VNIVPLSVLRRFEVTLYRNRSPSDDAQVPIPFGRVDFYAQGATVSSVAVTIASGASGDVDVYDTGQLAANSAVQAGLGGPTLIATVVLSPTRVTLRNDSGSSVAVSQGMRLVLTSNRPIVYGDPFGSVALGSSATADAAGRVTAYLAERRFDFVSRDHPAALDAASSATLSNGDTLSWTHTASGIERCVLVGVSWSGSLGSETLDSATYGGQEMQLVASAPFTALFRLLNPPAGPQTITVRFGPAGAFVYAVGGAISATAVHQGTPLGSVAVAQGTSTAPSVSVAATNANGIVVDTLGVGDLPSPVTATVGPSPQVQRWNDANSAGPFFTRGAGSTKPGTGAAVTMSWTLAQSKSWGTIAVELKPVGRLNIDAEGSFFGKSPFGVNALDYRTIQDAVNDLPAGGGVVFIPEGTYTPSTKPSFTPTLRLPFDKSVHLLGAGPDRTFIQVPPPFSASLDMIHMEGDHQTVEGMTLVGRGIPGTGRGIVIWRAGNATLPDGALANFVIYRTAVRDCRIRLTPSWGIRVDDSTRDINPPSGQFVTQISVWAMYDGVEVRENLSGGCIYIGQGGTTTQYFKNCNFKNFRGYGVYGNHAQGISLIDCIVEGSRSEDLLSGAQPYVFLGGCDHVLLEHCWFEAGVATTGAFITTEGAHEFVQAVGTYRGLTLDTCHFVRNAGRNLKAVRIGGYGRSVTINNPELIVADFAVTPDVGNILINAAVTPGQENEVVILGGSLVAGGQLGPIAVTDNSRRTVLVNCMGRMRVPRFTSTEILDLQNLRSGDMLFNTTEGKLQVYVEGAGAGWKKVMFEP